MKKDLKNLKKDELLALAKKHKIAKATSLKKDELVKAISKKTATASKAKKKPATRPATKKVVASKAKAVSKKAPAKKSSSKKTSKVAVNASPKKSSKGTAKKKKKLDDLTVMHQKTQHIHSHVSQPQENVQTFRAGPGELPDTYGETKLTVMVRDPYWAYSYWDLSDETKNYADGIFRDRSGVRPVLRVQDISGINFNGSNANSYWDIDVSLDAKNWYLNLGMPGASFVVDLGLVDKNGEFFLIARSNTISLPIDYPSKVIDEEWMISDMDFEELYAISGGIGLSSGELKKKKKQRFKFQEILSSGGLSSPSGVKEQKQRAFFLEVDTELILYGRTYSDASVTVDGKPIKLRSDGTFSLRYHLPDGTMKLPVKAISSDGIDTREKKIKVNKETK